MGNIKQGSGRRTLKLVGKKWNFTEKGDIPSIGHKVGKCSIFLKKAVVQYYIIMFFSVFCYWLMVPSSDLIVIVPPRPVTFGLWDPTMVDVRDGCQQLSERLSCHQFWTSHMIPQQCLCQSMQCGLIWNFPDVADLPSGMKMLQTVHITLLIILENFSFLLQI